MSSQVAMRLSMPDPGTLIAAIEAHLAAHPAAADSAEGVARWWLGSQGLDAGVQEVEAALDQLVRRQRLRRVELADGNWLYCGGAASVGKAKH
jgi:hypothetical protein